MSERGQVRTEGEIVIEEDEDDEDDDHHNDGVVDAEGVAPQKQTTVEVAMQEGELSSAATIDNKRSDGSGTAGSLEERVISPFSLLSMTSLVSALTLLPVVFLSDEFEGSWN